MKNFFLALASLPIKSISCHEFAKNLNSMASEAKNKSAVLLLLPEFSIAPLLEEVLGDVLKATDFLEKTIIKLASEYDLYICGGSGIYKKEGRTYNQSMLVTPIGEVIYQAKINLIESEKLEGLSGGSEIKIITTPFVKLAICVCYDIEFPEIVRQLALYNVDLILNPSYTVDRYGEQRIHYCAQARCIENHIYVAKSSLVGDEGHILTPKGFGNSILYAPIDLGFNLNADSMGIERKTNTIDVVEVNLEKLSSLRKKSSTKPLYDYRNLNLDKIAINFIQT